MSKIISYFTKSEFVKNALTLTFGSVIAQILPLIFYPILGRIFLPAEFGLLATLSAITAIIAIISSGMYESSILISKSKQEAANIVGLILLRSLKILLVFFILLQLSGYQIGKWLNEPDLHKWIFVCPIGAFSIVVFNCFNEWCVTNKYFVRLSWNKIINTSSITIGKVAFGIIKIFGNGLIIGDLFGKVITAGSCVFRALKYDKKDFLNISYSQFKPLTKKYIEFPKYSMPDQLLSNIGGSIPVFLIAAFFSSTEVGYFSIAATVLTVPISVISAAIRDVFRQRANEECKNNGNCKNIYKRLLIILSTAGIVASIAGFFILPDLFSIILGTQWRISGIYSQILLPMFLLSFVSMSLSGVLIITKKLRISMYWQMYYVCSTLLSCLVGIFVFKDIKMTLLCFCIGRCSAYALYIYLSYRYSKIGISIQQT
ncbi:MAG: hypothetical protein A2X19_06710 [Bacteroidetes bacterium GWE2_39_28]|nr:MAG: hypothetical protein A2X19_06710 [Bacteroidetes bacterium GWE2_39_28]OFY13349.1 MAG: hypothetical protein A2X16_00225 [Bacteroidetes bacterium GWF2_39_10]OFZ09723.1 MAG: hypothetical protein A2465_09790 [Bacteroidetes bacterium RIFOXYC2_FULL_39_11]